MITVFLLFNYISLGGSPVFTSLGGEPSVYLARKEIFAETGGFISFILSISIYFRRNAKILSVVFLYPFLFQLCNFKVISIILWGG